MDDLQDKIVDLRMNHISFLDSFKQQHSRSPTFTELSSSPESKLCELKSAERELALLTNPLKANQCTFYMSKQRRFCTFRSCGTSPALCSNHRDVQHNRDNKIKYANVSTPTDGPRKRIMRMKRMVNPLAKNHLIPTVVEPKEWEGIFVNPVLPIHIDFGCAQGGFVYSMAARTKTHNFLGLEIHEPLVAQANEIYSPLQPNLFYVACNARLSLETLHLPAKVQRASILFCDPHQGNHKKRRLVTEDFAIQLSNVMARDNGELCCVVGLTHFSHD